MLDAPRLGCLNIHASLLPRWRGAAPIQRAIQAGDRQTGITIMQMEAGLDTGPMLHKEVIDIGEDETGGQLHDRLAPLGASALLATLEKLKAGQLQPEIQDDALACYAHKLEKQQARIDWAQPAADIGRLIRAFNPWPVAFTHIDGKPCRIWQAEVLEDKAVKTAGTVQASSAEGIDVATADCLLRIVELQPPGKRAMSSRDFLNAHDVAGKVFD